MLDFSSETFSMNPCIVDRRQIDSQKTQIQEANATITTMHGEMEHMRGKVDEALKLIDVAKSLEEKIASVQKRQGFRLYSTGASCGAVLLVSHLWNLVSLYPNALSDPPLSAADYISKPVDYLSKSRPAYHSEAIPVVNAERLYWNISWSLSLDCCSRVEKHTTTLRMHEKRFEEFARLEGRIQAVEEAVVTISGEHRQRRRLRHYHLCFV